jgi:hypothetical protein
MPATDSVALGDRTAPRAPRRRDGVAGNARLTGGAAVLLLALLALEGMTIPLIGTLRGPHIFIGMLLIPPVLLKLGSTGYRFLRYYAGSPAYVRNGPPPLPLRLLAPLVVLASIALFATGVLALVAGPPSSTLIFLHKASFVVWFGAMTVHVLAHVLKVPSLALPDWRRHGGREARLAGAGARIALLGGSVAAGLALAMATVSVAGPWLS